MEQFLSSEKWENKFELVIDTKIFPKEIILKAAYTFLDRGYFFFKFNSSNNIILQFSAKNSEKMNPEYIIWEFSDELISVVLRDNLEKDNKQIRENIVSAAIWNSLDEEGFINKPTEVNQIDFDKDIDDILSEIGKGGGLADSNLYRVKLPTVNGENRSMDILCTDVVLPSRQITTREVQMGMDNTFKVAYGDSHMDINLSFILLNDFGSRYYFEAWQRTAYDSQNKTWYMWRCSVVERETICT